ncbi:MAG: hypothetical protein SOZ59_01405 [Candidatus Limivivens sp.]|nr:hypothetical protein [Candidatus Limivivens sp.]
MKKYVNSLFLMFAAVLLFCTPLKADAASWKQNVDGSWSYYDDAGKMLKKRWVGDYYIGKDGKVVTNRWIDGYFVGEDGKYIPNFQGGWQQIGGKWYYYSKSGKKAVGWITVEGKKYYLDSTGARVVQWQEIDGARYYFHKTKGYMMTGMCKLQGTYYYFNKKTGKQVFGWFKSSNNRVYYFDPDTGARTKYWREIDGTTYWFNRLGVMQKGWRTISGSQYYFDQNTGEVLTGFQSIDGKQYYFDETGKMQKNTTIQVNEKTYSIDSSGVCTEQTYEGISVSNEMLFFTVYESGEPASSLLGYAQTGGDSGNACGKYQFDYRYSLLPFIKYCYSADKVAFKEFKTFAKYTDSQKGLLQGNSKLYSAWKKIYRRNPQLFKAYQDSFAKKEYYDVTERYLINLFNISLAGRPDVVKGAVFSYAIQHGSYTAALAVKNAGIKNSTSNKQFITKLYKYRISQYPYYKSRYTSEKNAALRLL